MAKRLLHSLSGIFVVAMGALVASCGQTTPRLEIEFSDDYNGKEVSLVTYDDSLVKAVKVIENGRAVFDLPEEHSTTESVLMQMMVDGKVRAFYIAEKGNAILRDSMEIATGTPLNDRFATLYAQLDSVDNLDDTDLYRIFAEKVYNENRDNAIGLYFLNEYIRFARARQIDSLLITAPQKIKASRRKEKGIRSAKLREKTAPGSRYIDFTIEQPDGSKASLSDYVGKGKPVLVDFWASWCPYCIKELPDLKEIQEKYGPLGLQIVGVAVRDDAADTRKAIDRFGITWPVIYNAARIPYDIYGFAGIPHHMLIGADGTIISRGESIAALNKRLQTMFIK